MEKRCRFGSASLTARIDSGVAVRFEDAVVEVPVPFDDKAAIVEQAMSDYFHALNACMAWAESALNPIQDQTE